MPEDGFLVIAHRGASAYEPENTLPSFELAEELDADYIELDVHLTKDGELVVMHDDEVDRTTESIGKIKDHTLAELKELTADEDKDEKVAVSGRNEEAYEIPTLVEVIEEMKGDIRFVIELKDTEQYFGIEEKLVDVMSEYGLIGTDSKGYPKAVVHSFDEEALKKVHKIDPSIPLLQLISFDDGEEAELSKKKLKDLLSYASGIGVSYEALTPPFVNTMHGEGLAVYAYTVNDAEAALRLKAMGVNGIHTNEPDLLDE
ncbi:glycerophosphoryl diester phosphodiesterase [Sporosarcina luteola]|uniref:Glycerophosphoryl diester phosphodiesterase n=2 Tax=Sporosarcina luteola TaxID=582850 RepID=A0A511Z6F7_9BACL|nr:glycerophosphoryl diester phosphodiesterase [Sporosarcina luteola]